MRHIKQQFPIFHSHPNLAYLDSGASTQTPQLVLDAMNEYYTQYRANIHRGLYDLSAKATEKYEEARQKIARFLNADAKEIIFTSGTTHGLNFLARSLGKDLKPGNNVVLTQLEHHANLVTWQQMVKVYGFELRFIEINKDTFEINLASAEQLIDENTKVVSFAYVSNALGTIAPVRKIIQLAQAVGAVTIVDAAQAVAHLPIDVKELDCDYLVFSGHKMYGPTGIGVLYGQMKHLETLEPFFYGGDMISSVSYEKAEWAEIPERFEGGTSNIAGAIGLGAAVDFIESIGWEKIQAHEKELTEFTLERLQDLEGLKIIGPADFAKRTGVISFILDGIHPHDVAEILNRENIAIRVGHHCCMPLMKLLELNGTSRASLGIYNGEKDIERLVGGIKKVKQIFYGKS